MMQKYEAGMAKFGKYAEVKESREAHSRWWKETQLQREWNLGRKWRKKMLGVQPKFGKLLMC